MVCDTIFKDFWASFIMLAYWERVFLGGSASRDDVFKRFCHDGGLLQSLALLPGPRFLSVLLNFNRKSSEKLHENRQKEKQTLSINEPSGSEEVYFPNLKLVPLTGWRSGPVPASPTCPVPTVFGELLHSYVKLSAGFLHICSSRSQPDVPCESI